jgi:transposase
MEHYAGMDVSLDTVSVCIVDGTGRVLREAKVASEPDVLVAWFGELGFVLERIGMEAGPLSQWLHKGMCQSAREREPQGDPFSTPNHTRLLQ